MKPQREAVFATSLLRRVCLPNLDLARSLVSLAPKLCLGTHVRESFCFASGRGSDAKRSFADQRSQAELGNEGEGRGNPAPTAAFP